MNNVKVLQQAIGDSFNCSSGRFDYGGFTSMLGDCCVSGPKRNMECARYLQSLKILIDKVMGDKLDTHILHDSRDIIGLLNIHSDSDQFGSRDAYSHRENPLFHYLVGSLVGEVEASYEGNFCSDQRMRHALEVRTIQEISVFWHFLGRENLDLSCVEAKPLQVSGDTLLAYCARLLGNYDCQERSSPGHREHEHHEPVCRCSFDEGYIKLVAQSANLGDLARSHAGGMSPLLLVIASKGESWSPRGIDGVLRAVHARAQLWVKLLYDAGVDIEDYGQQEHSFFTASDGFAHTIGLRPHNVGLALVRIRLVNFRWGGTVEDWTFWWATSMDEIDNTFLLRHVSSPNSDSSLEERALHVPGAWVDTHKAADERNERFLGRIAMSRRRRKKHLAAAGLEKCEVREVFGDHKLHGWRY